MKLAVLETFLLIVVVSTTIVTWADPPLLDWYDLAGATAKAVVLAVSCVIAFYYNDLYDARVVHSFGEFAARLLQAFGVAFIILAGFYTIFPTTKVAGGPFLSSLAIIVGLLLPLRALSYGIMRSRPFQERVLIVGTGAIAQRVIGEMEAQPHFRCCVVGVVEDGKAAGAPSARYPSHGPLERLGKITDDVNPDRIIVALTERRGRLPVRELLEARARGIAVEDGVEAYERLSGKLPIETLPPSHLVFSRDFRKSRHDFAMGRIVSFLVSVAGLAVSAPLLLLVALAVKLDSRGPVFFVQDRVGLHGRHFKLIKFRTMHPAPGPISEWVRDNSDRITRVGTWLRKFRLDELPQFVNILRGDMNLVGPRPHPVTNFKLFTETIPYYSLRSIVRPGVTGWAQIRYGYANNLDEETEKMRYDLYYIKHLSLWLDLRILFDTVKIVLFGRGSQEPDAYPVELHLGAGKS